MVSSLVLNKPGDIDQLVNIYDNTQEDLVDKDVPIITKEMPRRRLIPSNTGCKKSFCGSELVCIFIKKC